VSGKKLRKLKGIIGRFAGQFFACLAEKSWLLMQKEPFV